ncbi:MAG: hypothetical protein JSS50_05225 [Proteobacteria bacterium]|nr:hypothetical protein [Pseudomonadota bacterium]
MTYNKSEIITVMTQDFRRVAIVKTLAVAGVMLLSCPLLAWWCDNTVRLHEVLLSPRVLLSEAIISLSVFIVLWYISRCPQCKVSWSYRKVGEREAPDGIGMLEEMRQKSSFTMPSVVVAYKCDECGYEKAIKRIKLLT